MLTVFHKVPLFPNIQRSRRPPLLTVIAEYPKQTYDLKAKQHAGDTQAME